MEHATGVNEQISALNTVEAALLLQPKAEKIGVIAGSSLTEQRNLAIFQEEMAGYYHPIAIHYHSQLEPEALIEALENYADRDILIVLGYMATPSG
ncbi:hypothetical protein [Anoxynatronum sibiricum]|uniref:Uncharacterized protein n=1 Tax=Anoxynatronum sibiricum TaxID=210623 RepID=A0ABU9VRR5_9CLOT